MRGGVEVRGPGQFGELGVEVAHEAPEGCFGLCGAAGGHEVVDGADHGEGWEAEGGCVDEGSGVVDEVVAQDWRAEYDCFFGVRKRVMALVDLCGGGEMEWFGRGNRHTSSAG